MLHLNWKTHFVARAENKLGNKNTAVYIEVWSPDKNDNEQF